MGTVRHKLSVTHFNGCLIGSALIGAFKVNWAVAWIALVVTLAGGLYAGNIRPRAGRR